MKDWGCILLLAILKKSLKLLENDIEQLYQKVQKLLAPSEKQLRSATGRGSCVPKLQ